MGIVSAGLKGPREVGVSAQQSSKRTKTKKCSLDRSKKTYQEKQSKKKKKGQAKGKPWGTPNEPIATKKGGGYILGQGTGEE